MRETAGFMKSLKHSPLFSSSFPIPFTPLPIIIEIERRATPKNRCLASNEVSNAWPISRWRIRPDRNL